MVFAEIKSFVQQRYRAWIDRRIPPTRSITLNQRRIFVFPSRAGRWFIFLLFVMLIAAINYQINMAFALVFLLSSVFIVAILHTYANMSGLTIKTVRGVPGFVGDRIEFEFLVSREGTRDYFDVCLRWPESEIESVTLKESPEQTVRLHLKAHQRGMYRPSRLQVETFYPMGLLRAWTWLAMDIEAIVYPRPVACELQGVAANDSEDGEVVPIVGSDDFYEFKDYVPGDPLKHVFWKSYAKGQSLQTKQYASYREQRLWLDWAQFSGDIELRLQHICYWVLKLEKNDDEYGLRLPGLEIAPAHGEAHKFQVLRALALFNIDPVSGNSDQSAALDGAQLAAETAAQQRKVAS